MDRNKNVEAVRGGAILCMVIYHYFSGITGFSMSQTTTVIVEAVGQFALISFFVISGFGTYMYFSFMEEKNKPISIVYYLKKRIVRIIPQYYFCLFIIVFFGSGIGYLSLSNIKYLLESLFLLQNFDPYNYINGVTWTIAVLFQLYVFSKFIYRGIKMYGIVFYLVTTVMCVLLKRYIITYIALYELNSIWRVVAAVRLPFTTFDLIAVGMLCAHFVKKYKYVWKNELGNKILPIFWVILYLGGFYYYSTHIGFYGAALLSSAGQSLVGLFIALLLFFCAGMSISYNSHLGKGIQFIAQNEYGIYLWHMILMGNFLAYKPDWFIFLNDKFPAILMLLLVLIAIVVGTCSNMISRSFQVLSLHKTEPVKKSL